MHKKWKMLLGFKQITLHVSYGFGRTTVVFLILKSVYNTISCQPSVRAWSNCASEIFVDSVTEGDSSMFQAMRHNLMT